MKTIAEVFHLFDQVGCCSFATPDGNGGVDSRIAHFFAHDEDGLYFRTMDVKPFYKQLMDGESVSVCGEYPTTRVTHNDKGLPFFEPGYQVRITGKCRLMTMDEVREKAQNNEGFNVAIYDIEKYPETRAFVLYSARGEYYDYDYAKVNRDHKLYRERFSFGGMDVTPPGLVITEDCISCGTCITACTFDAIEEGYPYHINGECCDECGNCYNICPSNAITDRHGILS